MPAPPELGLLIERIQAVLRPVDIWLFGSRARGDHRADSDWDLLAVLPDDAPDDLTDPVASWAVAYATMVPVTLLATTRSELEALWGLPNTVGYDLAREGVRLIVR